MKRNIIEIDEEKCTGCGLCVPDCHEGALKIVDGKARLIKDSYCDGLGACLKSCPHDALKVIEREAEEFDETLAHLNPQPTQEASDLPPLPCGCPGTMQKSIKPQVGTEQSNTPLHSELTNWPVQLKLLNPTAPYLANAELVVAADCTAFAYANFHKKFLKGKVLTIFCPKLDEDQEVYVEKLKEIFLRHNTPSVSIVHMEVPCCSGVEAIVRQAMTKAGKNITIKDYTVSLEGELV